MGYLNYVLLCSKITSFLPSEGEFSEKLEIFSKSFLSHIGKKMKIMIKNSFSAIMMHERFKGHQIYVLLCSKMTSFPPSDGVSEITFSSI